MAGEGNPQAKPGQCLAWVPAEFHRAMLVRLEAASKNVVTLTDDSIRNWIKGTVPRLPTVAPIGEVFWPAHTPEARAKREALQQAWRDSQPERAGKRPHETTLAPPPRSRWIKDATPPLPRLAELDVYPPERDNNPALGFLFRARLILGECIYDTSWQRDASSMEEVINLAIGLRSAWLGVEKPTVSEHRAPLEGEPAVPSEHLKPDAGGFALTGPLDSERRVLNGVVFDGLTIAQVTNWPENEIAALTITLSAPGTAFSVVELDADGERLPTPFDSTAKRALLNLVLKAAAARPGGVGPVTLQRVTFERQPEE